MKKGTPPRIRLRRVCLYGLLCIVQFLCLNVWAETGRHKDKLWLHRCNSIEKLKQKHCDFPNVEIDLVYRGNGIFDVTHDADTTFGLDVSEYFRFYAFHEGKMWLDIKNLSADNAEAAVRQMDSLCLHHGIDRDRLVIESPDAGSLQKFTQKKFYTSYYVAYDKPSRLTAEEKNDAIRRLQEVADSRQVCALSFPGWWYATIKKKLRRDIDLLTWKHRTLRFGLLASPRGRRMLHDAQLKIILVKSKGKYHR